MSGVRDKLIVAPSPHIHSPRTTRTIMLDVIIALTPALIAATVIFGGRALLLTAVCVASCVVFEWLMCLLLKKDNPIGDLSAIVTGMLLAFNLPAELPVWMAIIGSFVSIVIVKMLFGGIGQNFANPALVGRIVLFVSFSGAMTTWVKPFAYQYGLADAMTTATPLALIREGRWTDIQELLLGTTGGCLGETCALALLFGGVYLVVRRVISPVVPLTFIGTVAVGAGLASLTDRLPIAWTSLDFILSHVLSGGLLLGAIFMATDYATTPATRWGKVIFGFGCGLITIVIRLFGSYTEGVSFAILLMNILTPYIEKATAPKALGAAKTKKGGGKA